jgi:hypothetical protein
MTSRRRFGCRADGVGLFFLVAGLGLGPLGLSFASGCGSSAPQGGTPAAQTTSNNAPAPTSTGSGGSGGSSSGSQQPGSGSSGGGHSDASTSAGGGDATLGDAASSGDSSGAGAGDSTTTGDGTSTSDGGGGAQPDCTPATWKDPGTVPNPTMEFVAPDAGTKGIMGASLWDNIADFGYVEEEWFITGTSPAYTSRIVVHRPKDAAKFTGTVFMEWFNVTGGIDIAPLWTLSREWMMRAGHVHVSVSAQQVGANALTTYDSVRYAKINHPGDTAANAIFAQAGMAIRSQTDMLLGHCMPVRGMIAVGQSQSAVELGTYITSAQSTDQMFDGFLLHTNPSGATPTSNPSVPVFCIDSMTEADGNIVSYPNLVEWEVAGTTHNDYWLTNRGAVEQGPAAMGIMISCANPMNNYPSFWAWDAVLDQLHHWVRNGTKPPEAPPIQSMMDQDGNVLGGARLPDIDVPIATYTKSNSAQSATDTISSFACGLSGTVTAFTPDRLLQLYPTHDDYVQKYTQAADKAVAAGYMMQSDRDIAVAQAMMAPIPK